MTYSINRSNGTFLTSVADGALDSTTDLKFIGKNYSGFGVIQNENFLYLLENFSNTVAPTKPISGQVWYDSGTKKLKFYDGAQFKTASGAEISSTAPTGLAQGDLWYDTTTNQLSVWNGSSFVLIGPQSAPGFGTSQIVTQVVKDVNNTSHVILRSVVGGVTTAVFSNDTTFQLSDTNALVGFSATDNRINKGITLNSVTSAGVSTGGFKYWGTATNSEQLGGLPASSYITRAGIGGTNSFESLVQFGPDGLTVGSGTAGVRKELHISIQDSITPVIENQTNGAIKIKISNAASTTDYDDFMIFSRTNYVVGDNSTSLAIFPGITNKIDLGIANRKWKSVYATSVYGNLTGNVTGDSAGAHTGNIKAANGTVAYDATTRTYTGDFFVGGNFTGTFSGVATSSSNASRLTNLDPSKVANPGVDTIPVRDSTGKITAVTFQGQATDAQKVNGRSLSIYKDPDTVALRTIGGDLEARFFNGTATSAHYADLAEIYKTDKAYAPGTVVSVGGKDEVTESTYGDRAVGVISTNPAYLMNKDAEGQPVALRGRVPCKVRGTITKGAKLVAGDTGHAVMASHHSVHNAFALALESHFGDNESVIEVIVL